MRSATGRPSLTRSIGRDRSLERLSADSQETVSQFEFSVGTGVGTRETAENFAKKAESQNGGPGIDAAALPLAGRLGQRARARARSHNLAN
jgi:hypothetical protein